MPPVMRSGFFRPIVSRFCAEVNGIAIHRTISIGNSFLLVKVEAVGGLWLESENFWQISNIISDKITNYSLNNTSPFYRKSIKAIDKIQMFPLDRSYLTAV